MAPSRLDDNAQGSRGDPLPMKSLDISQSAASQISIICVSYLLNLRLLLTAGRSHVVPREIWINACPTLSDYIPPERRVRVVYVI